MNIIKYIFYILLVADINHAYHLIPCIHNIKYRDIKAFRVLKKKCGYIRNSCQSKNLMASISAIALLRQLIYLLASKTSAAPSTLLSNPKSVPSVPGNQCRK